MDTDYNRPRRPNPDTLTYLKSLPFNESHAHEEIVAYVNQQKQLQQQNQQNQQQQQLEEHEVIEYPQNLSAALSAIDEIKNEIASIAGDEFGSQCIETIARITMPYSKVATKKLLLGISGYIVHLSTHRYGSHVVQTILQNVIGNANGNVIGGREKNKNSGFQFDLDEKELCTILEIDENEESGESNDVDVPTTSTLNEVLISITEEIIPATKELAVHICGSHVLRSLLCILSGVKEELPQHIINKSGGMSIMTDSSRRGKMKQKKKKKKKYHNNSMENDLSNGGGMLNAASFAKYTLVANDKHDSDNGTSDGSSSSRTYRVDANDSSMKNCFFSLIWELTGIDFQNIDENNNSNDGESIKAGDLQQYVCNQSAGPLFIVLLKILTLISSPKQGKSMNNDDDKGNNKTNDEEKSIADFRLGIMEEQQSFAKGSYAEILAKKMICWDDTVANVNNPNPSDQIHCGETIYGLSGETRGSHMLETLFRISNNDFYENMCHAGKFFDSDSFVEYAEHEVSNFVIQTLLNTVRTRSQAENLVKCVEGMISNGYVLKTENKRKGILWRCVEMSAKFRIGQETLLKSIRKGFTLLKKDSSSDSSEDKTLIEISDCIPLLIGYRYPETDGGRIGLDAVGTRTTYHLLRFVPRLCPDVINGILSNFSSQEIVSICNDGLGSRCIIDGILEGPTHLSPFNAATKELCKKLTGQWTSLSVERVGHHTVKKVFMKLNSFEDKALISSELSNSMRILSGNAMGRSIITDCAVRDYIEGEEVWKITVKKAMERETFLKEITQSEDVTTSKRRKRKRKKKDMGLIRKVKRRMSKRR